MGVYIVQKGTSSCWEVGSSNPWTKNTYGHPNIRTRPQFNQAKLHNSI